MQTNHFAFKVVRLLLFLLLCGTLSLACTMSGMAQPAVISATGELNGYHIPFSFDPLMSPQIIVQISINGQKPLPFWVDTGLSVALLIDTKAANKLRIIPDSKMPEVALGAIKTRQVTLQNVAIVGSGPDPKDLTNIPLNGLQTALVGDISLFQDMGASKDIAGVIGIDVLNGSTVQFDFTTKRMTLYTSAHPPLHITGATSIPIRQHKGHYGFYYVTLSLQKNLTTELLIDTGADHTDIPIPVARRLQPAGSASIGSGSAYGVSITPLLLLPSIQIGDCIIEQVSLTSETKTAPECSLGMDILSRFRVTLDFPNKVLLLERPADYAQRVHIDGSTGIRLLAQNNGYVIAGVEEGSSAQKAGVQTGDQLLQVDGKALDNLSSLVANGLLAGYASTRAELTLKRPTGQQITVTFDRSSTFARSLPVDGLFLDIPAHKPMALIGLLKDCAGEQAGLKQGDIILEFNGHPTQDIAVNILADEFRKPLLTLKVRRKGATEPLLFTLKAQAKAK